MTTATQTVNATGIDAHFYLAKDLGRAIAFYRDVIGLEISIQGDGYVEFDLGDGSTFGLSILPNGRWFPGGGVMFAVADAHAALATLREAGTIVYTDEAQESPICFTAWCEDPEGNNFAIHQSKLL